MGIINGKENKYLDEHGLATLADQVRIFRGTRQQWNLLSTAQKKLYSGAELEEDTLSGALDIYSETETRTNKVWIDGKPIYRKVIDCGVLPNSTTKSVAHGISNISYMISIVATANDSTIYIPLPNPNSVESNIIYLSVDNNYVNVTTGTSRNNFNTKVILEYTKTTD